ncbi:MAG: protein-tyrosine-phosphatase [Bacteroidia bacterium]
MTNAISLLPRVEQRLKKILQRRLPRRHEKLEEIARFMFKRLKMGKQVDVVFVCTHNSRRSVFAEVWCNTIAASMGFQVRAYSAGTEATAVNPAVVRALTEEGFRLEAPQVESSPAYKLTLGKKGEGFSVRSKKIGDEQLPKSGFLAVMVCTDADEACPVVPGAAHRIALPYKDPRHADGTDAEKQAYADCSAQIATELWFLFSRLEEALGPQDVGWRNLLKSRFFQAGRPAEPCC